MLVFFVVPYDLSSFATEDGFVLATEETSVVVLESFLTCLLLQQKIGLLLQL